MKKPIIAVTMGDPHGIGPEITLKALQDPLLYEVCTPVVLGDHDILATTASLCSMDAVFHIIDSPKQAEGVFGQIDLIDFDNVDMSALKWGTVSAAAGQAAFAYIQQSITYALDKQVDSVVTGPINKESLQAGNIPYIGHTEMFAALTNTEDPLTMFEVHGMRIFFLSRHVSLRQACDMVTEERLMDYIHRCTQALKRLGVEQKEMAVAGLNPHSGDGGLFGDEEITQIIPAIQQMREKGYPVVGPISADSVFYLALQGHFSSVLSLYHDQGHIAAKTLDFEKTVALTNGLPFLRVSVDHGTAFDIAGKNKANQAGTIEAIKTAAKYTPYFR